MLTRANRVRPSPYNREKNKLLAALPSEEVEWLRPHLQTIPTTVHQILEIVHGVALHGRLNHSERRS
jgi:hypothetical protein